MKMRLLLVVLFLVGSNVQAATITLDFEEFSGSVSTFQPVGQPQPAVSQGFILDSNEFGVWVTDTFYPGSVSIGIVPDGFLTLSAVNGQVFSLESFDYSTIGTSIIVSVFNANGRGDLFTLGGMTGDQVLRTYDTAGLFDDILSVTFFGNSGSPLMDNIRVSAVPIPAAVWLFGSALAGLGWLRRKQTV
jgi:hypothetical protein